jgi:hypothetical protein
MCVFVLGVSGKLQWQGNWISFMDTMLQFSILGQNTRELYLPTRLQKAIINIKKHKQTVEALSEGEGELHLLHIFEALLQIRKLKLLLMLNILKIVPYVQCLLLSLFSFLRMKKAGF